MFSSVGRKGGEGIVEVIPTSLSSSSPCGGGSLVVQLDLNCGNKCS